MITARTEKGETKMYNDRDQCVDETARENTLTGPTLKAIIAACYKKSGEMIEECLEAAFDMFGDDFPKLPGEDPEPQTLLQAAMCTSIRLGELQNVLNALFTRTLG